MSPTLLPPDSCSLHSLHLSRLAYLHECLRVLRLRPPATEHLRVPRNRPAATAAVVAAIDAVLAAAAVGLVGHEDDTLPGAALHAADQAPVVGDLKLGVVWAAAGAEYASFAFLERVFVEIHDIDKVRGVAAPARGRVPTNLHCGVALDAVLTDVQVAAVLVEREAAAGAAAEKAFVTAAQVLDVGIVLDLDHAGVVELSAALLGLRVCSLARVWCATSLDSWHHNLRLGRLHDHNLRLGRWLLHHLDLRLHHGGDLTIHHPSIS
mmetsp:Transcript_20045/g.41946  ORF Transcript_20045/g.41946 Transcript_20045/m.41946 type:complete len:265 (-) Transcript_20045:2-796(-)